MKASLTSVAILGLALPAYAQDLPVQMNLEMTPNLVRLLDVDRPIANILIGSAEVADTTILGAQTLSISARNTGQTSIVILGDDNRVIASLEVSVVSAARGLDRRPVTVRMFGSGRGEYEAHSYFCSEVQGCDFNESSGNKAPTPIISTGPIITNGASVTQAGR